MTEILWLTHRGERHQSAAKKAAPPNVRVTMRRDPTPDDLHYHLSQAKIVVSERNGTIDHTVLERAPHLQLIVRLGSMAYDIDLAACQALGIRVSRQPVMSSILVAEHLVMALLSLLKNFNAIQSAAIDPRNLPAPARTDEDTFRYNWLQIQNIGGVMAQSIAIVGMGEIGVELARRLRPFAPQSLLYYKRTPYPHHVETELGITYAELETCFEAADVVINLLPYSPQTDLLIDRKLLGLMRHGGYFLHAGSGSTVHEADVAEAVHTGWLAGVAFDTYEYEPLQADHPLVTLARNPENNVILTPHVAAGSGRPNRRGDYAEIERFLNGEPLRYQVV